mmetsp:Transcript_6295/g.15099  ORF Transcript_6295/g.15099 Transcript_6295/m.15099 type:complete len:366 (+) Transcript_6295:63-1160(+)
MTNLIPAVAAYGGGVALREAVDNAPKPSVHRKDGLHAISFKLSARVVAAAVPGLTAPGLFSQKRPFLEACLGSTTKETELADYATGHDSGLMGQCARECPWRFVDTLTFKATSDDILGPGLQMKLRVRNDMLVGPLKFELQAGEVGAAGVDLRKNILPSCVQKSDSADSWTSPVQLVPFHHVMSGLTSSDFKLGDPVAYAAVQFSVNSDPEQILEVVDSVTRPLKEQWEVIVDNMRVDCPCKPNLPDLPPWLSGLVTKQALDSETTLARAQARAWSVSDVDKPLPAPERALEGWVSVEGPRGQKYWHHTALGPAPWSKADDPPGMEGTLPSPDEAPQNWRSHKCSETGRTFWHHEALGPAPWEAN